MIENKNIKHFIKFLSERLKKDLPGIKSHKQMAPTIKGDLYRNFTAKENAFKSAVLILFIIKDEKLLLLFTLRSNNISHSGQISFPGGRFEKNETAVITALRETKEEVGINKSIKIIGQLSTLYVPPSKSIIYPVVGFIDYLPKIKINSDEVQEAFTVPFENFLSEKFLKNEIWNIDGKNVNVPFWNIHPTPLWGASAMILKELIDISQEFTIRY